MILFRGDVPPGDVDLLCNELKIKAVEIKFKTLAGRGADIWTEIGKKLIYKFLVC